MNLKSKKATIHKDQKTCFEFLSRPENYQMLMPKSAQKFELNDQGGFIFQLKGMPEITLKLQEAEPDSRVVWASGSDKFRFTLSGNIQEISPTDTEVQLIFDGNFSPMLEMIIKNPLQKFIDTLSENMETIEI